MRHRQHLKHLNSIKDRGHKIRYLMDILGNKNTEISFLRKYKRETMTAAQLEKRVLDWLQGQNWPETIKSQDLIEKLAVVLGE